MSLFYHKGEKKTPTITEQKFELTPSQKTIIKEFEISPVLVDISSPPLSVVDKLKKDKKVGIKFFTDRTSELYLTFEADVALAKNSILRKLTKPISVKGDHFSGALLDKESAIFSGGLIGKYKKLENRDTLQFPVSSIAATLPIAALIQTLQEVKDAGSKVGDWYAQYENSIFLTLLAASQNKAEALSIDSICSLYGDLIKNPVNRIFILPESLKDEFFILEEEVKAVINVRLYPVFIEDRIWKLNPVKVDIIVLEDDGTFNVGLLQNESFKCAGLIENESQSLQSMLKAGYYINGKVSYKVCTLDGNSTKINTTVQ
jgi:hypothetical protein